MTTQPEQVLVSNLISQLISYRSVTIKTEALNTKVENGKTFKKGLLQQMFV
ncbi:hypothetical protein ACJRPK_11320 [Aquimarina sp. 2-A2]|uniref:hypothetical protein n=1 Tax=Aquimarina sp. 2-A2 TaxID=3382644 RepID=UPI00387EF5B6